MSRFTRLLAILLACAVGPPALAACPWIVQPSDGAAAKDASYAIMFNGRRDFSSTYYGFTAIEAELIRQLSSDNVLPDLLNHGRPLMMLDDDDHIRYRPDPETVSPFTIYLVASTSRISELDAIAAEFRPTKIPYRFRSPARGGSNVSGPLPHRSLPGYEIQHVQKKADFAELETTDSSYQLCAYQVRAR